MNDGPFSTLALVCSQALDAVDQADAADLKRQLTALLRVVGQAADIEAAKRGAVPMRLKSEWEAADGT